MKGYVRKCIAGWILLLASALLAGCTREFPGDDAKRPQKETSQAVESGALTAPETGQELPVYDGMPYAEIEDNRPSFDAADMEKDSFETYSPLDGLGRCGVAYALVGQDLMPTQKRGNISHIKPSGWQKTSYDFVEGKSLYNRCHLIAHQLTAEDANKENLITGTRYFNTEGMLPFENEVADYVKETGNHVLYRVTPYYEGDNLVASGVRMEGYSVEDEGAGICFDVYVFNVQPGVVIDYATGESREETAKEAGTDGTSKNAESAKDAGTDGASREGETVGDAGEKNEAFAEQTYVLNTNTKKFHRPECSSTKDIKPENRQETKATREELTEQGYDACKRCEP